jgi:predicted PurR-regulated permease PerM
MINLTRRDRDWLRALVLPLTILAWLAVIVIGIWLLTHVVKTILTLVLSAIVAFALTPLVTLLSRWLPRGVAIGVAYLLGFTIIFGLGALLVVTAAAQVTNLVHNLPTYADQAQRLEPHAVSLLRPFGVTVAKVHQAREQVITYLQGIGTTAAKDSISVITGILGTIVDIVLVLILSVYLTANGPKIAQGLRREMPSSQRSRISLLIAVVNQVVGGYIRGTLTLAVLIGLMVGIGMTVLGVHYAVLLGVLAFFMEFVPVIGVLVSGGVCVLIALFQGWVLALIVLAYFVVVHVIEGDVVGPRIMGGALGIHPATAIIALVAGTELFGFWGALFGAPLAGLLQAIGTAAWREMRGGNTQEGVRAEARRDADDVEGPSAVRGAKEGSEPGDGAAQPVSGSDMSDGRDGSLATTEGAEGAEEARAADTLDGSGMTLPATDSADGAEQAVPAAGADGSELAVPAAGADEPERALPAADRDGGREQTVSSPPTGEGSEQPEGGESASTR